MRRPELLKDAWVYFNDVQTKDVKYAPRMGPQEMPALEVNKRAMERFLPELRKVYYDPAKYPSYLDQLKIHYPTVRQ